MNIFARCFCRVFQAAFRLALPVLPYREPERLGGIADIADLLCRRGIKSAMLVTDSGLRGCGLTKPLEELLDKRGVRCIVYDGTCANPTVANVEEARTLYLANGCECLIAFGGGSSMDCAKALGARIAYPKKPLGKLRGVLRVLRRVPLLIAVPTTAGTGSEVTLAAVITDGERKHKYTMNDFTLIPRYAVLDPEVTYTLPPHLTATTGMDALTHAVEAYIGRSTNGETRRMALTATELIFANIERAYRDGYDREARANMLKAAYCAGIAFSKSYVGYIHAVAHSLGGQYNTPHGLANSVLLPLVLEDYGSAVHKKLKRLGVAAGVADESDSPAEAADKFIAAIRALNARMNIPARLACIRGEDIPVMARHAAREANPLYPVPVLRNAKELERYYRMAAERREDI